MSLVIDDMPDSGITRLSRWIFNCYVLQSRDGVVVVDAGLPRVARDLAAVLIGSAEPYTQWWRRTDTAITWPECSGLGHHHSARSRPHDHASYLDGARPHAGPAGLRE